MELKVYHIQYDNVIKGYYLTIGATYRYAVKNFIPLINKLEFQRNPLRKSFYERLENDILNGCIMPNITLAINSNEQLKDETCLDEAYIENNLDKTFVLDGIQRLSTMKRIADNPNFPQDRFIYCNILVCNSMDRLLYRMITLNNGQKPMTARHQIEILASNIFNFDELPILAVTEKEGAYKRKTPDMMRKEVLIKGYLAYISNSVNIDNQKIIESKMDELIAEKILESNVPEKNGEFKDVICFVNKQLLNDYLRDWFQIPNNFIGFCAAMNQTFFHIQYITSQVLVEKMTIFEEAFSALDISKIKLGITRRKLVQDYFEHYKILSSYNVNQLVDHISQEI
ncbi:hypothetical protein AALC25_07375 [Lachnospiraceae bacterium 29-84]